VDEGDANVFGDDDAPDDRPLVPARPLQRQGLAPRRRLHQDRRRPAHLERQAEVEAHPGVEAVRRVRADLGDEVIEVPAFGGFPFQLHPQDEGEGGLGRRGEDEAGPARRVDGAHAGLFPRVEDLRGERPHQDGEQAEGEKRLLRHSGKFRGRPPRLL
jgi:hypothetical protein